MRFSLAALGLFCAAASAAASEPTFDFDSITKPEKDQIVKAGSTVEVAWSIKNKDLYEDVKVDIQLHGGKDDRTLSLKDTVATKIDNSDLKYKWSVDSSLGSDKMYGIKILISSNETVYQWSNRFTIKNAGEGSGGSSSTGGFTGSLSAYSTESDAGSASTKTTSATSKQTTSASASTSKSAHTTTAASSASASGVTTSTTNGTTTAVSTVTQTTPSHGAAAGLTARVGVAGAIVGCVAMMAL